MPLVLVVVPLVLGYSVGQWAESFWLGLVTWAATLAILWRVQLAIFRAQDERKSSGLSDGHGG